MKRYEQLTEDVAGTILQQLGGNKFLAMTGAKNLFKGKDDNGDVYIGFRIPKAKDGINYVKITYQRRGDDYKMEFVKIRGNVVKTIYEGEGFYFDDLQRIFTMKTGLDTHL